jgi:hypothetical protein
MRIVTDADTEIFTDSEGDTLTLLKYVRREDRAAVDDIQQQERLEYLRSIGPEMLEAAAASNSTPSDDAADDCSDKVKRERFRRIVRGMALGGNDVPQNSILGTYDKMDGDSAGWVDDCVASVWDRAYVSLEQLKKPVASA